MLRRPTVAANVVVQEVRDELCLLRVDTGDVLVLNQTATDVWLLASDGLDGPTVAARLAEAYGEPVDKVTSQVEDVLATFEERGFLVDQT